MSDWRSDRVGSALAGENPTVIWPRYDWEPEALLKKPVWLYPSENWADPRHALGSSHDGLRSDLAAEVALYRNAAEFRFNV